MRPITLNPDSLLAGVGIPVLAFICLIKGIRNTLPPPALYAMKPFC